MRDALAYVAINAYKQAADTAPVLAPLEQYPVPSKPYKASELARFFLGSREYPQSYLSGEHDEYQQELTTRNRPGIEEELQDVLFAAQMLAYHRTGKDRRVVGANPKIKVFIDRISTLRDMFRERGVPFHVDYLIKGSNWAKPEKIMAAFEAAGSPISLEDATRMRDMRLQQKVAAEPASSASPAAKPVDPAKRDATRYYQWVVENPSLEGFRARAYDDDSPKKLRTIGYGINLQDAGNLARLKALFGDAAVKGWLAGQPMTRAQSGRFVIDRVMNQDIPALRKALPGFDAMPALARLAMISARYNGPTLIGPKLCGYMAAKNYPAAVGELAYGHNSNLLGHARRRNLEAVMLGRAYGLEPTLTEQADPAKRALLYDQYMQGLQQAPAKE